MSATLSIQPERIMALMRFGYSDSEAAFLTLAALHSGYFVRRQVAQFLGCKDGATVTKLAQRVLSLEHARASTWRQNTQLYHLCARPFYEALGEPDNRNRRQHQWTQVKNKIIALDYVLAHPDVQYLATEREKLDYFHGTLEIELAKLPAKVFRSATNREFTTRYFVDKYPIFVTPASQDGESPVSFCFVDEGTISLSRFESYLVQYQSLFESLASFQLIFVAAAVIHFAGARAMFERFRTHHSTANGPVSSLDPEELLAYFRLRQLYEQRAFDAFDRSQLIRLRDSREAFSRPEIEALYITWQSGGAGADPKTTD